MKFTIEFCRTRDPDGAQAVVGRETTMAGDLPTAIVNARRLGATLDMPQQPDSFRIKDIEGATLFSCRLDVPDASGT
jgi:hypothetical protein